jgi:hypothetical protein
MDGEVGVTVTDATGAGVELIVIVGRVVVTVEPLIVAPIVLVPAVPAVNAAE